MEIDGEHGYTINKNDFAQQLKKKIVSFSDEVDYNLDINLYKDSVSIMFQEFESRIRQFESEDELSAVIGCGEWFVRTIVENNNKKRI